MNKINLFTFAKNPMMYVLCGSASSVSAVVGTPVSSTSGASKRITVKYVYQKTEYTETYEHLESFSFPKCQVQLYVPVGATGPCLLPLPSPFNQMLKLGSTLLFQVDAALDFVGLWNECCALSVTWQHNRPKKITDPSQKLGLPPKLNDYLKEQVFRHGLEVPVGSDVSEEDAALNESETSGNSTSDSNSDSGSESDAESEDYYSSLNEEEDNEGMEEEEEVEDEPEPEELLEDE